MSRILGIDPGEARIGVAISDDDASIAFPRETILARGGALEAAQRVKQALVEDEISLAVVGLPLRLDGSEGEAARRARAFGAVLAQVLQVEVGVGEGPSSATSWTNLQPRSCYRGI